MSDQEVALELADGTAITATMSDHPTVPAMLVYRFEYNNEQHAIVSTTTPQEITAQRLKVALAGQYVEGEDAIEAGFVRGVPNTAALAKAEQITQREGKPEVFMRWCSIVHLNNVTKNVEHSERRCHVSYRSKIKLHGTNAAVQLHEDGRVIAQSRKRLLSATSDNAGFHAWVTKQRDQWQAVQHAAQAHTGQGSVVVYGEWCGPGIQKDDAICLTRDKQFCVFSVALPTLHDGCFQPFGIVKLINDPTELNGLFADAGLVNTHVLPWHSETIDIVFGDEAVDNQPSIKAINALVDDIGEGDPWVKATFDVDGPGEGLVWTPITVNDQPVRYMHEFQFFAFKAKDEQHGVKKGKPAAMATQVSPSTQAFVDQFATPARLQQGLEQTGAEDREGKTFGRFLGWMLKDIEKESQDELDVSGLRFGQVKPALIAACKHFYFTPA